MLFGLVTKLIFIRVSVRYENIRYHGFHLVKGSLQEITKNSRYITYIK